MKQTNDTGLYDDKGRSAIDYMVTFLLLAMLGFSMYMIAQKYADDVESIYLIFVFLIVFTIIGLMVNKGAKRSDLIWIVDTVLLLAILLVAN